MKKLAPLLLLLLVYAILLSYRINDPFWGPNDDNPGLFGIAARNWVKHGSIKLKLGQQTPSSGTFYLNHPQGITLPLAFSYQIFGIGEWQTRLVPILFSLASLTVFWFLLELVFKNRAVTIGASLFYVFFPTSVYFGRMMSHESVVRFFMLFSLLLLLLFQETKKNRYGELFLLSVYLGGLLDWPYFFAAFALWLYVLVKKDLYWRTVMATTIPVAVLLSVFTTLFQFFLISGRQQLLTLYDVFLRRAYATTSFLKWIAIKGSNETLMFTGLALVLATIGAFLYFSREPKEKRLFAFTLFFPGFLHFLIFRGGALHAFWSFYLTPFIALMAWWALMNMRKKWRIALLIIFFLQSSWQTYSLFSTKFYTAEDFLFLKEVDRSLPRNQSICLSTNISQSEIMFYLDRNVLFTPCAEAENFVLRRWEPAIARAANGTYGLNKPFISNARTASVETALAIEFIRSIPLLREELLARLGGNGPDSQELRGLANADVALIAKHKLKTTHCAPNFCLYAK